MGGMQAGQAGGHSGGPIDGEWFRAVAEMEDRGWI